MEGSEESNFMKAAERQIDRLVKANRWQKVVLAVCGVMILLLAWFGWNQHEQAIDNCHAANSYKAAQSQIWDKLFALSFGYKPPAKGSEVYKLDEEFLTFVHQTDAPRGCPSPWNVTSASAGG